MRASFDASPRPFVGRERECRLLGELIGGLATGGGAVMLRGEAGIGKTALLEQIAARAPGRVLWVRGVESEAVVSFAAVADLLLPLRAAFDHLPQVQRDALEVSLALKPGGSAGPLTVCAGALGVLAAAGECEPLLVVVDDFQWVDPSSQQVLVFVARRLAAEHVVVLLAVREQPGLQPTPLTLPAVDLAGLSVPECRDLVATLGMDVSAPVLGQLVEQTGGNPLAVIETIRSVPPELLRGGAADLVGAQVGPSLQRIWSVMIDELPESTRVALFVLAASQSTALGDLAPVLTDLGVSLADLGPAERSDLVQASPHGVELRHPLLRAVILQHTPLDTRLVTHRVLAEHADEHQRIWYLAASVTGPDDTVAEGLAAAAAAARDRSGYQTSARTWRRAADFTVAPSRRAERLLAAAHDADLGGESDLARRWCEEALSLRSDPCFAADVELIRSRADTWLGHPLRAADNLVRTADAVLPHDPQCGARLYAEATTPYALAARFHEMLAAAARSETAHRAGDEWSLQTVATSALAFILAGQPAQGRQRLDLTDRLATSADPVWDLQYLTMLGCGRVWLEEFDAARPVLAGMLDAARQAGAPSLLAMALGYRSELDWWTGHWAAAYADATEALHWVDELQGTTLLGYVLFTLARLDAARGDHALCRQRADRARQEIGPHGIGSNDIYLPSALGLAELGAGDPATAAQYLDQAWQTAREAGLGSANAVTFAGDLVEAHIRAGHPDRASQALDWLDNQAATTGLAYPTVAAARCHGLLATTLPTAERCFATTKALHQRCMPFEYARTLLCEAETLRRLRRPAAVRPLLQEALTVFTSLGARPWAARAEAELAATGARPTPHHHNERPDLDILTPQEFQIARTIAEGRNNTDTAAALYLSRKTVEAHLTRIYRKLNIRSRTQLTRLLTDAQNNTDRR